MKKEMLSGRNVDDEFTEDSSFINETTKHENGHTVTSLAGLLPVVRRLDLMIDTGNITFILAVLAILSL